MRCLACGGEMILMKAIEDVTMAVPGFERHSYMCPVCYDTEQRLVFNKHAKERDIGAVPLLTAPPTAPATASYPQPVAQGFLQRALARIRGQ